MPHFGHGHLGTWLSVNGRWKVVRSMIVVIPNVALTGRACPSSNEVRCFCASG